MGTSKCTPRRKPTSTSRPLYVVQEHYAGSWATYSTSTSERQAREDIRVGSIFHEYSTWRFRKYIPSGRWIGVDLT
jgi:hypothetical protein